MWLYLLSKYSKLFPLDRMLGTKNSTEVDGQARLVDFIRVVCYNHLMLQNKAPNTQGLKTRINCVLTWFHVDQESRSISTVWSYFGVSHKPAVLVSVVVVLSQGLT